MGLRGPGAGLREQAQAALEARARPRRMPWKRRGLSRVERVIAFLQFLPITKGKLTGRKLQLLPDQRRFIEAVYGANNGPVRIGIYSEPRGNGKTGLAAGLCLCHLLGPEAEPRGECYSAGIDREQAAIIFDEMEAFIRAVPEFQVRVNVLRFHRRIEVTDHEGDGAGSKYAALSADARRGHGLAPSFWVYDELAQVAGRELLDNLQTAMGKRKRTLGMVISTQAATDDHPLSELIDDGLLGTDGSIVVHLTAAPPEADPFDHAVIRAANPALGVFLDEADVFAEAARARRMRSFESKFRNLRLNQRIAAGERDQFMMPAEWRKGDAAVRSEIFTDGRPVFGGLDLSARTDLSALVLAARADDGVVELLPFGWTPAETIAERKHRDRAPYDAWVRNGQLLATPGPAIDQAFIAGELARLAARMNLIRISYDRYRIHDLRRELSNIGVILPLIEMGQGFVSMAPAVDAFEALVLRGCIRHGGHPVMRWCIANAVVVRDAAGNRKFDKSKAYGRIDLAVAALMAIGAMETVKQDPLPDIAAMVA
jgi:phage terminase large subunit-like protein